MSHERYPDEEDEDEWPERTPYEPSPSRIIEHHRSVTSASVRAADEIMAALREEEEETPIPVQTLVPQKKKPPPKVRTKKGGMSGIGIQIQGDPSLLIPIGGAPLAPPPPPLIAPSSSTATRMPPSWSKHTPRAAAALAAKQFPKKDMCRFDEWKQDVYKVPEELAGPDQGRIDFDAFTTFLTTYQPYRDVAVAPGSRNLSVLCEVLVESVIPSDEWFTYEKQRIKEEAHSNSISAQVMLLNMVAKMNGHFDRIWIQQWKPLDIFYFGNQEVLPISSDLRRLGRLEKLRFVVHYFGRVLNKYFVDRNRFKYTSYMSILVENRLKELGDDLTLPWSQYIFTIGCLNILSEWCDVMGRVYYPDPLHSFEYKGRWHFFLYQFWRVGWGNLEDNQALRMLNHVTASHRGPQYIFDPVIWQLAFKAGLEGGAWVPEAYGDEGTTAWKKTGVATKRVVKYFQDKKYTDYTRKLELTNFNYQKYGPHQLFDFLRNENWTHNVLVSVKSFNKHLWPNADTDLSRDPPSGPGTDILGIVAMFSWTFHMKQMAEWLNKKYKVKPPFPENDAERDLARDVITMMDQPDPKRLFAFYRFYDNQLYFRYRGSVWEPRDETRQWAQSIKYGNATELSGGTYPVTLLVYDYFYNLAHNDDGTGPTPPGSVERPAEAAAVAARSPPPLPSPKPAAAILSRSPSLALSSVTTRSTPPPPPQSPMFVSASPSLARSPTPAPPPPRAAPAPPPPKRFLGVEVVQDAEELYPRGFSPEARSRSPTPRRDTRSPPPPPPPTSRVATTRKREMVKVQHVQEPIPNSHDIRDEFDFVFEGPPDKLRRTIDSQIELYYH